MSKNDFVQYYGIKFSDLGNRDTFNIFSHKYYTPEEIDKFIKKFVKESPAI